MVSRVMVEGGDDDEEGGGDGEGVDDVGLEGDDADEAGDDEERGRTGPTRR